MTICSCLQYLHLYALHTIIAISWALKFNQFHLALWPAVMMWLLHWKTARIYHGWPSIYDLKLKTTTILFHSHNNFDTTLITRLSFIFPISSYWSYLWHISIFKMFQNVHSTETTKLFELRYCSFPIWRPPGIKRTKCIFYCKETINFWTCRCILHSFIFL